MRKKVIALADSHVSRLRELPPPLARALHAADIIVHAGDITEMSLLEELREMAEVVAVSGNMDSIAVKLHLPHRQLVTMNGKMVGVIHGSGAAGGMAERVRGLFPEAPDLIIFGHSHTPFCKVVNNVLMVNPGSAKQGYADITIADEISAQLVTA